VFDGLNHWLEVMASTIGTFIAAAIGVAMRYTHQIQQGIKVDWSRVWLDGPMMIVAAWCGQAAHEYFHVPELIGYVCAALLTYLGEKGVTLLIEALKKRSGL
jgi:hypothetical protein